MTTCRSVSVDLAAYPTPVAPERIVCWARLDRVPVPKGRPRFDSRGHAYTPEATAAAERELGWALLLARRDTMPEAGWVGVRLLFALPNRRRIDLDNLCKLAWDSANGVLWQDDAQVVECWARVVRGVAEPMTEMLVYRMEGL